MGATRTFFRTLLFAVFVAWAVSGALGADTAAEPVKLLLLSGQSNHDWKTTTPLIERAFKESGRFAVEITEHPEALTARQLARFDVLVSNWNSFHRETPPPVVEWPEATRAAYLDFVRGGKGHVVIHAGSSSFYHERDWPEYHELVMARYGFGMTGHGVQHIFPVRIEAGEHPITRGMREFAIHDELWHSASVVSNATVLASAYSSLDLRGSGRDEPIAFVRNYGEGRSFTILLGHGTLALTNAAFKSLLCRGTEWAATGSVTLPLPERWPNTGADVLAIDISMDDALAAIAKYRFGQNRTRSWWFKHWSKAPRVILGKPVRWPTAWRPCWPATPPPNVSVFSAGNSRGLARNGTLRRCCLRCATNNWCFCAEHWRRFPASATEALCDALKAFDGPQKLGLVASLGRRGDASSIPVLVRLATVEDKDVRNAAITALGCMNDATAADALLRLRSDLPAGSRSVWADALLRCARQRTEAGRPAASLYEPLTEPDLPEHVRTAAFAGLLGEAVPPRSEAFLDALRATDTAQRQGAVNALRNNGRREELAAVASQLVRFRPIFSDRSSRCLVNAA